MSKINFLSGKFHFYSIFILFLFYLFSSFNLFIISLIIYLIILFLFRIGKQRNNEFIKNENYMDEFVYSPIYGKILDVIINESFSIIRLRGDRLSLLHSWSISSPKDLIVKNISYDHKNKTIELISKNLSFIIKSLFFRSKIILDVGDRIYSRSIFGYVAFGGIIELKIGHRYKILVNINDKIERSKTILAKLN